VLCFDLGRFIEAEAYFRRGLSYAPESAWHQTNLGCALCAQDKLDDARYALQSAVTLDPGFALAWFNLGTLLVRTGKLDEASHALAKAVQLAPDDPLFRFNRALVLLKQGHFAEGWKEHEWRPSARALDAQLASLRTSLRRWHGEPLKGRSILIRSEQGPGDTLQFFRYVQPVIEQRAHVTLECQSRLVRLLRANTTARVVAEAGEFSAFDFHTPLMSLPHYLGTRLDTIPRSGGYILAEEKDNDAWRKRLTCDQRIRVGLARAGGRRPWTSRQVATDAERSIHFSVLKPLLAGDWTRFYSLQMGEAAAQAREAFEAGELESWQDESEDLAGTAALIANLDPVISVDTAVAHLSAAMGKPTWILLGSGSCWRWLEHRDDSPWYSSVRLFRQIEPGDWCDVTGRLTRALDQFRDIGSRESELPTP